MRLNTTVLFVAAAACSPLPQAPDAGFDAGRPVRPAVGVTAGDTHVCARMADGAVRCWGTYSNPALQSIATDNHPSLISGVSHATALALGLDFSCALLSDAGVSCWGSGQAGQLGNGDAGDSDAPVAVVGLSSPVVELEAGGSHACARMFDGTVACWGSNVDGELGDGSPAKFENTPSNLGAVGFTELSLGQHHSCALRVSGTPVCWGANGQSQLGDATTATRNTPVPVTGAGSGSQVGAGENSCLVTDAKGLTCWGAIANFPGTPPTAVPGYADIAKLSVGAGHVCALIDGGTVACSGDNTKGQLGDGTMGSRVDGGAVPGLGHVTQVAAGNRYSCAVIDDGGVQCWGDNALGQLGDGTRDSHASPKPVVF